MTWYFPKFPFKRRKLRADVQHSYPHLSSDDIMILIPNKTEMTVTKITTHSGEMAVFYSVLGEPVFFETEQRLYPTVYTLWKYPSFVKLNFVTWPAVLERLVSGADLMLPGIVLPGGVSSVQCFERDDTCIVTIKGNRAPVAVGRTTLSRQELLEGGLRGKGVKIIHVFTDCLWAHGSKTLLPQIGKEQDEGEKVLEEECEVTTEKKTANDTDTEHFSSTDAECKSTYEGTELDLKDNPSKSLTSDEVVEYCFFCATLNLKGHDFPVLTSTFFRNHMARYCPEDKILDIKKSSYKKLSKFLQSMQERGIIVQQELSKGVDSITAVDYTHAESFKASMETVPTIPSGSPVTEHQGPIIQEMVSVSGTLVALFADVGYAKDTVFNCVKARQIFTEYIKKHDLVATSNARLVVLDPVMTKAVVNKNEDITSLPWDNLFSRLLNKMNSCYQITLPGKSPVIRKGKIDLLEIIIEQRMGNKKVTLVRKLETYGIDPQEFAHKLQLAAASSTSVSRLPGKSAGMQVLVQGNQISIVASTLIDEYKILRKYISGLEQLKNAKKKKS